MAKNFAQYLTDYLNYQPNPEQLEVIQNLENFIRHRGKAVFLLTGYAGTGKTSLMAALVRALRSYGINSILLAPTGRAAKVFAKYARKPAFTIHRKIYKPKDPKNPFAGFTLAANKHKNTIFIVDEASMISNQKSENSNFGSGYLLNDLLSYVYSGKNCKLIVVGDTAQLPPVGLTISPALDPQFYHQQGYALFHSHLTTVARQKHDSGILFNATRIRQLLAQGKTTMPPKLKISDFDDIIPITGAEIIDALQQEYDNVGIENTLVITRTNRIANKYNAGIRSRILFREERLSTGDRVMIVKNNYYWTDWKTGFIANGDIGTIQRIYSFRDLYNKSFAKVELFLEDYEQTLDTIVMLDTLDLDAPSLSYEQYKDFYNQVSQDYEDITSAYMRMMKVKKNKYFNALQIKFAYAVTCHKAQGGQWNTVFIDQTFFSPTRVDTEYFRWLYTALTRATNKVYLVNFDPEFLEN